MNLCCDYKIAKVDCWLSGCPRHFDRTDLLSEGVIMKALEPCSSMYLGGRIPSSWHMVSR